MIKQKIKNQKQAVDNPLIPSVSDSLEFKEKVHPSRTRKKYQGELIQLDASSYKWFSDEVTHLHIAIDDASGNIVWAYFDTQETLKVYYYVLNQILTKQGIPVTFLTDKRTVFEYQRQKSKKMEEDTSTQFGFACRQLGIDIKTSSVPEAKGSVERLNQTVKSRLPVELEQAGISTIDQANEFLTKWIVAFNRQFCNTHLLQKFMD